MTHFRASWSTGWPMRSGATLTEILEIAKTKVPEEIGQDTRRDMERLSVETGSDDNTIVVMYTTNPSMRTR